MQHLEVHILPKLGNGLVLCMVFALHPEYCRLTVFSADVVPIITIGTMFGGPSDNRMMAPNYIIDSHM